MGRRAAGYLNAALLSPQLLYLTHQPPALAVAAAYNAARDAGARMPESAWWEVFDVDREELGFLVVAMRSLQGWADRMRAEGGWLARGDGVLTRAGVREELAKRGFVLGNGGGGAAAPVDEEAEMMRRMDERMAGIEGP